MVVTPAVNPLTTPAVLTLAIDGVLLLQVPPEEAWLKVMVLPEQTEDGPVIAPIEVEDVTLINATATAVPQVEATV